MLEDYLKNREICRHLRYLGSLPPGAYLAVQMARKSGNCSYSIVKEAVAAINDGPSLLPANP